MEQDNTKIDQRVYGAFSLGSFARYERDSRTIDQGEIMSLSGGRSSAYVYMMLLNDGFGTKPNEIVSFQNTGKENENCLSFVRQLEMQFQIPILWLEYTITERFSELLHPAFCYEKFNACKYKSITEILDIEKLRSFQWKKSKYNFWYSHGYSHPIESVKKVNYLTASRNGKPFCDAFLYKCAIRIMKGKGLVLPNASQRWCTGDLKEKTMNRYLNNIGITKYTNYVGMRHDEPDRVVKCFAKNNKQNNIWYDCPAHWKGVTKTEVLNAWKHQPFDLGRCNVDDFRYADVFGNCDWCHLKAKIKKLYLIQQGVLPLFWQQIEDLVAEYNGEIDCMSRQHGTYREMVTKALSMDRISIAEVLSSEEKDISCFGCGN